MVWKDPSETPDRFFEVDLIKPLANFCSLLVFPVQPSLWAAAYPGPKQ